MFYNVTAGLKCWVQTISFLVSTFASGGLHRTWNPTGQRMHCTCSDGSTGSIGIPHTCSCLKRNVPRAPTMGMESPDAPQWPQ